MAETSTDGAAAAADTTPQEGINETSNEATETNDNNDNNINNGNNNDDCVRIGTISSARFNILSTMVGGGCLSLPLAFQESGNALVGPLVLLVTGAITEFCFRLLVSSATKPHPTVPGTDTFESIASAAFGPRAHVVSMGLVVLMCFFGTVGYSVLLRDMMEPLNDAIAPYGGAMNHTTNATATATLLYDDENDTHGSAVQSWLHRNFTMFLIVVLVTPFCTLRRLTALKDCGAASMLSLLVLGTCIVVRSVQCNTGTLPGTTSDYLYQDFDDDDEPWYTHLRLFPDSWHDLLNALPLYISCFVCHYNILPVHNELTDPTPARVSWWLRSTTWFAVALYMVMGFAGSSYAHCTPSGKVQGNILLDFDEKDPLLMVGRMCLAVTITLAFPMLVIPGRDIVVRSLVLPRVTTTAVASAGVATGSDDNDNDDELAQQLREPLLVEAPEEGTTPAAAPVSAPNDNDQQPSDSGDLSSVSFVVLLSISVILFWSAAALASLVSSIDVVWDLLGSSLSILMSYLIPAGSYLVLTTGNTNDEQSTTSLKRLLCWLLLCASIPLMVVSTANAVYNTFG